MVLGEIPEIGSFSPQKGGSEAHRLRTATDLDPSQVVARRHLKTNHLRVRIVFCVAQAGS